MSRRSSRSYSRDSRDRSNSTMHLPSSRSFARLGALVPTCLWLTPAAARRSSPLFFASLFTVLLQPESRFSLLPSPSPPRFSLPLDRCLLACLLSGASGLRPPPSQRHGWLQSKTLKRKASHKPLSLTFSRVSSGRQSQHRREGMATSCWTDRDGWAFSSSRPQTPATAASASHSPAASPRLAAAELDRSATHRVASPADSVAHPISQPAGLR